MEELEGRLLGGRYRLERRLGQGGMGAVYAGVQEDLGRRVAVKVLHPHLAQQGELLVRFRREALAAAALGHPNIVQVTDFAISDGDPPFLVMDLLEGRSLAGAVEHDGPLPGARAAFVAAQVLDALDAAHRAGIVHRDLKPENVFLTRMSGMDDIVKLLDFGIAKLTDTADDMRLTETGMVLGTPAFMAPEQARGQPVDARTDVYGVGVVLYHALTGRLPFDEASYNAMIAAIIEREPEPLATLRPDLPPELVAIVERACAKSAADRFASAAEMRAALEPYAVATRSGAPPRPASPPSDAHASTIAATPEAVRPAPPPVARPPVSSNAPWIITLIGVGLLFIITFAVIPMVVCGR